MYELEKNIEDAVNRYHTVKAFLITHDDDHGLSELEGLVDSSRNYIERVSDLEKQIKMRRVRIEDPQKLNKAIENLDQNRRTAHNAMMSRIGSFNRHLYESVPGIVNITPGGIYSGNPDHLKALKNVSDMGKVSGQARRLFGDWTGYLVEGLHLDGLNTEIIREGKNCYGAYSEWSDKLKTYDENSEEFDGLWDFLSEIYFSSEMIYNDKNAQGPQNYYQAEDFFHNASRLNEIAEDQGIEHKFGFGSDEDQYVQIIEHFYFEHFHNRV